MATRIAALPLVAALGFIGASAFGGSSPSVRVLFSESFDDDELGAAPAGAAGPGAAVISSSIGFVEGSKSSSNSVMSVIREDFNEDGNCLSIGDFDGSSGGPVASFHPSRGSADKTLEIGFDLKRVMADPTGILTLLAIDNRTTPGTGRLLSIALIGAEGKMLVGGKDTGFSLAEGEAYRVSIDLALSGSGPDFWTLSIQNLADPADSFVSGSLRTHVDGDELSEFQVSAHGAQGAFVTIDNVEIVDLGITGS